MASRLTAREYAELEGLHEETVTRWCRNMLKPAIERNSRFPVIVCRKRGRDWQIDPEATERMQAMVSGNPLERDLARMRKAG